MEVTCENCKTKLNIPDEKIPRGQRATVTCPKCSNRITIEGPPAESENGFSLQEETFTESADYGQEDPILDTFEEGVPLALVMVGDASRAESIKKSVEELGYRFVPAEGTHEATGKMRFHGFDLVILEDGFDGAALDNSPIMNYLNHQPMSLRRGMFVVLMSPGLKTRDQMKAFALSADLVVNPRDLNQLTAVLKNSIAEKEKFYKVFMDTMKEVGKA